ncbi:peptidoglycan DD-metalloendopeptidase family protein [Candidatus Saccharibacteria bacterium]|nr:peptidoglycan DD-metalloendopeptidase family protein [Candidatus Saccharibacteria bacterium]
MNLAQKLKTVGLLLFLALFTYGLFGYVLPVANAQTAVQNNLESEIDDIRTQIDATQVQLDGVRDQAASLEETLNKLASQIDAIQQKIAETKAKIAALKKEITETQAEIDRQKSLLTEAFRSLYQHSNASALELILASDNFSEYLDTQEYLNRLKDGIADSVLKVQELKAQLETQQAEQESLLSEQKGQEVGLKATQDEKNRLLDETRGQEAIFQQQLEALQEEERQKEAELQAYLASLISSAVSLGPVSKGDIIGKMGNTGWSTGPHLHFQVYKGSNSRIDPISAMNSFGWIWPVGGGGGWLSQGFHSGHQAIDIAGTEGTPILATASGQIIHRGCLYSGNYLTFGVIIDHGDYYSLYIHMQAPNNPKYAACSINRRSSYGTPSIDYSTTE